MPPIRHPSDDVGVVYDVREMGDAEIGARQQPREPLDQSRRTPMPERPPTVAAARSYLDIGG